MSTIHLPVLPQEVLHWLAPKPGQVMVDGTVGGGGHTRMLAEKVGPDGLVIGVDRDQAAVDRAAESLSGLPVKLATANFADIPELLEQLEIESVDGMLLDLGLSSDQLADQDRGFSYRSDGPLDLRFDRDAGEPAWKLINRLSEKHLADLIYQYGEERMSRRVARKFVAERQHRQLRSASEIAELIRSVVPRSRNHSIDPATRTFQALRIAVNEELKWIKVALQRFPEKIRQGGRVAVISFHSLEDRLVKEAFREHDDMKPLNPKPIVPGEEEILENPRSRSSRLRVAEKT